MTADEARAILQAAVAEAGSQKAFGELHNLSQPYVGDLLAGRRDLAGRVLDVLGLERIVVVTYRRKDSTNG